MKLLFCCEFYYPSVGGVQEVMRQIAERLVQRGHDVTVATTWLPNRDSEEHNGVRIAGFRVAGNLVRGIEGEFVRYRQFVQEFECDAILIKAAQQWTFDALWPVLDNICTRKVFIPCGFSGLYEPAYRKYFEELPAILHKWDHLIFYADDYRDTNFTRQIGYENLSIFPNGASEVEFAVEHDRGFRQRHGIPEDSFLFLTVGTLTGAKGHREVVEAFAKLDTRGRPATLILNGNRPIAIPRVVSQGREVLSVEPAEGDADLTSSGRAMSKIDGVMKSVGARCRLYMGVFGRAHATYRRGGWAGIRARLISIGARHVGRVGWLARSIVGKHMRQVAEDPLQLQIWIDAIKRDHGNKLVILTDLPRGELIQAFKSANLFVFASNVEYSPLVLYEATAAGLPFLTVPVGNAEEIARWTQAGMICPASKDERGYTRVDTSVLSVQMTTLMDNDELLAKLGRQGRARWQRFFTWDVIASCYERVLEGSQVIDNGFMNPKS